MTSKKYIIQPLSLPPPTRHTQNGSRTIALLAKNSKSLHALSASDVKKRDKESNLSLPCSIYDQHKDFDCKKSSHDRPREKDLKDQSPHDLETDLKDFRNYLKNEKDMTPGFVTPFQNVTSNATPTEGEKEEETNSETNGDFSSWIREMNSKLVSQKRQIRSEKKRAEREKHSTLSASPRSSPSVPKKQKYTLFQLKKKKTKKEDEYDTLGGPTKRETITVQPMKTPTDDGSKFKNQFCKSIPTGNMFTDNGDNISKDNKSPRNKSPRPSEPRLFQLVRPRTDAEDKPTTPRGYSSRTPVSAFDNNDDTASNSSSSSSSPSSSFKVSKLFGKKSKSFSFMKSSSSTSSSSSSSSSSSPRTTPRTLAPAHHSEHDMRAKRLPRNVVSVSISS